MTEEAPKEEVRVVPEDGTPVHPVEEAPVVEAPQEEQETKQDETPVEEPKEEAAPTEDTPQEDEPKEETDLRSEYNEYDNPALKQVVNIMVDAELPVAEANAIFAEAAETGDLSKINKAALVEKLGQDKADVVLVLAESYYNTEFSSMKAIKDEVHKLVGGEDNFTNMSKWANDKAATDPAFAKDFSELKAMFDSKQPRAINAAAKELFELYKQDPGTTITASLEVGDAAVGSAGVEPMTRREYTEAVAKAHRNGTYEAERASLWARRSAGQRKGI